MSGWLALDIGGANLKAAHTSGATHSVGFPLWKHPDRLASSLQSLADAMPAFDHVAVTMTGELCDCFTTKAHGVRAILDATADVFAERTTRVWTTSGRLVSPGDARAKPHTVAAANWLALATAVARLAGEGLLLDVGSTTADIIPLHADNPIPVGRTDTDRLQSGELVYAGVKRTPVCALATSVSGLGAPIGLAAELFATTRDVYLMLGDLSEDLEDTDTADGRPATVLCARDRLARMIAADRDTFSHEDAVTLATELDRILTDRLVASARRVIATSLRGSAKTAVISGSGEFLADRVARRVLEEGGKVIRLSEVWGRGASDCACAYALAILAGRFEEEAC